MELHGSLNMIGYGLAAIGSAIGVGMIFAAYINGVARQPEAHASFSQSPCWASPLQKHWQSWAWSSPSSSALSSFGGGPATIAGLLQLELKR